MSGIQKYNAVKHGVLRKVLLPEESKEAEEIQSEMIEEYRPQTITESLLIETLSIAYVRRQRAINAEREFFLELINPTEYEEKEIIKPILKRPIGDDFYGKTETVVSKQGYDAVFRPESIEVIEKTFARYITTCERQFYRALHELQRIRDTRSGRRPSSIAVDVMNDKEE